MISLHSWEVLVSFHSIAGLITSPDSSIRTSPCICPEKLIPLISLPNSLVRSRFRLSARILKESASRSEEHTSELQSRFDLVCRLLLEKKKKTQPSHTCTRRD